MDMSLEELEMELAYWQQEAAGLQRQLVRAQIKLKRYQDAEATQAVQEAEAVMENSQPETAEAEQTKTTGRRTSKEK